MAASSIPPMHPREDERLRDLYALRLLDTQLEERFQRYTSLTADLFNVPISLISLVDRERQWFKAVCGLDQRQTSRDVSFCAHSVAGDAILVVPDATADPRFANNSLVTGPPYIRFYAGVPIHSPSGLPLGTLCIIDFRPRRLTRRQRGQLQRLAALVEHEVHQSYQIDQLRREIDRNTFIDSITHLPNARMLKMRLRYLLRLARERRDQLLVGLLDVKQLGTFNEAYGWETGNELLRSVAARLRAELPETAILGRWQDSQFMLICPEIGPRCNPPDLGRQVLNCFAEPLQAGGRGHHINVALGIATYPLDALDAPTLIQRAGTAMRMAAGSRESAVEQYRQEAEAQSVWQLDVLHRLRQALGTSRLQLVYQPKFDVAGRRITGVEALLRWTDPELGAVPADETCRLAEETGLIHSLGEQVLRTACRQAAAWVREGLGCVPIAVNLTARQLHQPDLVAQVTAALEDTGLDGRHLMLEVTEGSLITDIHRAIANMRALGALGVRFAVDDFGTGYSSFSYLAELPVDSLKIDRSFLGSPVERPDAAKIITGIVQLAHGLGLHVVAEGVETETQLSVAERTGCDEVQGFYFGLPMPPADFAALAHRVGTCQPS